MQTFNLLESEVRGYCRAWPTVFESARGWKVTDESGREFLDFFAGAGALNYGHNHPALVDVIVDYLRSDGILHSLDMATTTKRTFLERFDELILKPRGLDYKLQFPGPAGTNAVEAALKLARKVTGRENVVSFTNAFHGMTLGSLAVTANSMKRAGAGVPLSYSDTLPFAGFLGDEPDTVAYFEAFLADGTGMDNPAAVIVETVQAEGGINVASFGWLRALDTVCKKHGILLIVDDIQVGCGRTGSFFSWEGAGIDPDMVCLSKSLSGSGLPFALVLLKPEHDVWTPGEHNGTFRGINPAFATATAALEMFWSDGALQQEVTRKADLVNAGLEGIFKRHDGIYEEVRGRGLIQGLVTTAPEAAGQVTKAAFDRGLLAETAGPSGEVVKLLPPLIVDDDSIQQALEIVDDATSAVVDQLGEELLAGGDPEEEPIA